MLYCLFGSSIKIFVSIIKSVCFLYPKRAFVLGFSIIEAIQGTDLIKKKTAKIFNIVTFEVTEYVVL